jgi:hypothetical protein
MLCASTIYTTYLVTVYIFPSEGHYLQLLSIVSRVCIFYILLCFLDGLPDTFCISANQSRMIRDNISTLVLLLTNSVNECAL